MREEDGNKKRKRMWEDGTEGRGSIRGKKMEMQEESEEEEENKTEGKRELTRKEEWIEGRERR
jgi:hypothetical protein